METEILGNPEDFIVQQHGSWWMVTNRKNQETIYAGPGPVEVFRSPAPF